MIYDKFYKIYCYTIYDDSDKYYKIYDILVYDILIYDDSDKFYKIYCYLLERRINYRHKEKDVDRLRIKYIKKLVFVLIYLQLKIMSFSQNAMFSSLSSLTMYFPDDTR